MGENKKKIEEILILWSYAGYFLRFINEEGNYSLPDREELLSYNLPDYTDSGNLNGKPAPDFYFRFPGVNFDIAVELKELYPPDSQGVRGDKAIGILRKKGILKAEEYIDIGNGENLALLKLFELEISYAGVECHFNILFKNITRGFSIIPSILGDKFVKEFIERLEKSKEEIEKKIREKIDEVREMEREIREAPDNDPEELIKELRQKVKAIVEKTDYDDVKKEMEKMVQEEEERIRRCYEELRRRKNNFAFSQEVIINRYILPVISEQANKILLEVADDKGVIKDESVREFVKRYYWVGLENLSKRENSSINFINVAISIGLSFRDSDEEFYLVKKDLEIFIRRSIEKFKSISEFVPNRPIKYILLVIIHSFFSGISEPLQQYLANHCNVKRFKIFPGHIGAQWVVFMEILIDKSTN
jgi:hypothetical protein